MTSITGKRIYRALRWRAIYFVGKALSWIGLELHSGFAPNTQRIILSRRTNSTEISAILSQLRPLDVGMPLIRVGNSGDGGYLLPNTLESIQKCFSAGSDLKWHFEKNLDNRFSIPSTILDSEDKRPQDLGTNQDYVPKWLARGNSVDTISMADWIQLSQNNPTDDLLLQMDIEGAEYDVLSTMAIGDLRRFRILVIEFHGLQAIRNKNVLMSPTEYEGNPVLNWRGIPIRLNDQMTTAETLVS